MTEQKPPPIPDDHPIQEIWKIGRRDTSFLIELAKSGDSDAAKTLMIQYVYMKDRERLDQERGVTPLGPNKHKELLEEYVIEAIRSSIQKKDVNLGFNLKTKEKHRPKSTYKEKLEYCRIGYRVAVLRDEFPSDKKAIEQAAIELGISESHARHCYEKYMKIKCK